MNNGTMLGAGVLLLIIGLILLTGIIQALLTAVAVISIIAGLIIGVIGIVGMLKGNGRGY